MQNEGTGKKCVTTTNESGFTWQREPIKISEIILKVSFPAFLRKDYKLDGNLKLDKVKIKLRTPVNQKTIWRNTLILLSVSLKQLEGGKQGLFKS